MGPLQFNRWLIWSVFSFPFSTAFCHFLSCGLVEIDPSGCCNEDGRFGASIKVSCLLTMIVPAIQWIPMLLLFLILFSGLVNLLNT